MPKSKAWIAASARATVAAIMIGAGGSSGVAAEPASFDGTAEKVDVTTSGGENFSLGRLAQLEQLYGNGSEHEGDPLLAGYDRSSGFFIRDEDNRFLLRIGGRVQVRYTYKARGRRGGSTDAGEVGSEDDSYGELERARLTFQGHVLDPRLGYFLQMDGDTDGGGGVDILDYLVSWKHTDYLTFGAGQHKPYFLRQEKTSSGRQQMVDRSLANEFFNIDRTLAVWVEGYLAEKRIFYAAEIGNGFSSRNRPSDSVDQVPHFAAKVDFNVFGEHKYEESDIKGTEAFVVGASFASDQNNGSSGVGGPEFKAYVFGLDAALKMHGFSLAGEYMGRWLDLDADESVYQHGFYAQAGTFLVPETFEVAARVSSVWGNEGVTSGNALEVGPGFNWFFSKSHRVKLSADILYFDISENVPIATTDLHDPGVAAFDTFDSSSINLEAGEQGVMLRTQIQLQF